MSLPTPTAAVRALQLNNRNTPTSSSRVDVPDAEGRKRRRITPINLVTSPSTEPSQTVPGVESGAPGLALSPQPGTWDFLAKWEDEDSSILDDVPVEEYYSDVSGGSPVALEDENDEDEGEDVPAEGPMIKPSKLGADRVVEIINDCIEKYAAAWKPGKGETKHKGEEGTTEVPVVYDADALWDQAHAAGEREEFAEKYELEADYYRQRLDKLCDEISKDPGDTEAAIKMRCRNLEVTVELLERATWFEGIYKLPPDPDSDDESSNGGVQRKDQLRPAAPQTLYQAQRPGMPSQLVDLGTSSGSDCSDDEDATHGNIPLTPPAIEPQPKIGGITRVRDLSSDAVLIDTIEEAIPAAVEPTPKIVRSRPPLGDAPEHASIASVSHWSWSQIEETQDRKRAVSRAILEMNAEDREVIRQRLQTVGRTNMVREIPACIGMLSQGGKRMPGILPQDLSKIVKFTRLFLCWWLCGNFFHKDASREELDELADCLRKRSPDPATFCDYVDTVLSTTFSGEALCKPTQPSQAEIIEISDGDEPPAQPLRRKANIDKPGSVHKSKPIVLD
ncbi:hypothetical protein E8E11_001689 [Didymella keratinophila]|nr:hypothetical protein E8E11_001689 [Didymella keratinophila]